MRDKVTRKMEICPGKWEGIEYPVAGDLKSGGFGKEGGRKKKKSLIMKEETKLGDDV